MGYGIKTESAALRCSTCRWWTGYDSTKGGVINIDTVCSVCGSRLRHTRTYQGWIWGLKTVAPAYAQGSGAHNRSRSVIQTVITPKGQGKKRASYLNREHMKRQAARDDIDLEDVEGQFSRSSRRES